MIVAFDPGRNIGVAYVDSAGELVRRAIVDASQLESLAVPHEATVLVGDGTGGAALAQRLRAVGLTVEMVEEASTTLEAQALYFRDNPPRGWQRLLPIGMRSPPGPIDDYAAYAIARRWLERRTSNGSP